MAGVHQEPYHAGRMALDLRAFCAVRRMSSSRFTDQMTVDDSILFYQ
jgi:hypothetical protein